MIFSPVTKANLEKYSTLFATCFPKANHLDTEYLNWLYFSNPAGVVVGFDAIEDEQVVAHYVCIPVVYNVSSSPVLGLLSLNTATSPSHQGKGLFTKLAQLTYEMAASKGYEFVIGVANANSTPGFIKKLDFTLVKALEAFAFSPFSGQKAHTQLSNFERLWSAETLSWRLKNPKAIYKRRREFIISRTSIPGLPVFSNGHPSAKEIEISGGGLLNPLGVFIGFSTFHCHRVTIPEKLKPSPLNFIYRRLSGERIPLETMKLAIDFLDFDAY